MCLVLLVFLLWLILSWRVNVSTNKTIAELESISIGALIELVQVAYILTAQNNTLSRKSL